MKIDLHIHSHYSDGMLSPSELIEKAVKEDVKIISITDHEELHMWNVMTYILLRQLN